MKKTYIETSLSIGCTDKDEGCKKFQEEHEKGMEKAGDNDQAKDILKKAFDLACSEEAFKDKCPKVCGACKLFETDIVNLSIYIKFLPFNTNN